MDLDSQHYLTIENIGEHSGFKTNLDIFKHFIAVRKGKNKNHYDIYHSNSECSEYIGRIKANRNATISKSSKNLISKAELNDFDKKILKSLVGTLNCCNHDYMRFLWLRYSNKDEKQFLYIDHRDMYPFR